MTNRMRLSRRAVLVGLGLSPAVAYSQTTDVDLNLVLAVDDSHSVTAERWAIQRQGYALAFQSPDIMSAIQSGPFGAIAVTLVRWSGRDMHKTVVPWTRLYDEDSARGFANQVSVMQQYYRHDTSIGTGLLFAAERLHTAPFRSSRMVIDISGDDTEADPIIRKTGQIPVPFIRDEVVAAGIVINGLPLLGFEGVDVDLNEYYKTQVIGGPGCFSIPVVDPNDLGLFTEALKKKLVREIFMS